MNYHVFDKKKKDFHRLPDLVPQTNDDGQGILVERDFTYLDGITASSYSLRSMIANGTLMQEVKPSLPSKSAIVDQSINFTKEFKK